MLNLHTSIQVCIADPQPIMRTAIKACLRTVEGIHVAGLVGTWDEIMACLNSSKIDVVVIDQKLLKKEDFLQFKKDNTAAWLVLAHHKSELNSLLDTGFQGVVSKDTGVSLLTKAVLEIASGNRFNWDQVLVSTAKQVTLTAREQDVVACLNQGLAPKEIASKLGVQEKTVKRYIAKIQSKGLLERQN
jgi:DNA-binding NarL/FixJ family response regulator